jgi:hypothetical protein
MSYIGEADEMLYKQQDREDKRREFLEQRSRMGGPEVPEACETCEGKGYIPCTHDRGCCTPGECMGEECPRCLGTGVQA